MKSLISGFGARERETEFFGVWHEAMVDGVRVAFQEDDYGVTVHVGGFDPDQEQLTDVYLGTVGPGRTLPREGSQQRIDGYVGEEGRALAARYFLCATGDADYPQLRIPGVRDALAAMSDSILEVGLYEDGGLHLQVGIGEASEKSLARDVKHAVAMAKALDVALVTH